MRLKSILVLVIMSLALASCGPILGQLVKVSEGVKEFEVTSGDIKSLKSVKSLLVYGPFKKGPEGRYICRGEDAANIASAFNKAGLFKSALFIERDFDNADSKGAALKGKSGADIKSALGLKAAPDTILFGTILFRDTTVAPSRGIVMDLKLKLEFYNVSSKKTTTVVIHLKELNREINQALAEEFGRHL